MKKKQNSFWMVMVALAVAAFPLVAGAQQGNSARIKANAVMGRKFIEEGLNAKSAQQLTSVITEVISPSFVQHNNMMSPGRDGLIQFLGTLGQSFPDGRATVRDVFATSDRVVVRWTFAGTLTGQPFLGIAPAAQKIDLDVIDIFTVQGGQLYEHWDQIDWVRALVQLGAKEIPAPFVQLASQPQKR